MHFSLPFASLALAVLHAGSAIAAGSNVIDLTPGNFESHVGAGRPALVEFFAPWCGHCKTLAPIYEQLADAFAPKSGKESKVVIAKTDADGVGKELGQRFGVRGFPTLKWFPADDSKNPIDYEGGRDLDSLAKFITENSGVASSIKAPAPPAWTELDHLNFHKTVQSGKDVLVAFTAPWCGHCKSLKPVYDKVASIFKSDSDVVIAQINADDDANRPIASEFDVKGFPTIKFFPADGSGPIDYQDGRTENAIVEFINEKAGTYRTIAGSLSEQAGKILSLDTLANLFYTSAPADRASVIEKAQTEIGSLKGKASDFSQYYVKAMENVASKGDGWLSKEIGRLSKLSLSPSLAPAKLDELTVKKNILSSFLTKRVEQASQAVGDAAQVVLDNAQKATASVGSVVGEASASIGSVAGQASASIGSVAGQASASIGSVAGQATDSAASVASAASASASSLAAGIAASGSSIAGAASASGSSIVNAAAGSASSASATASSVASSASASGSSAINAASKSVVSGSSSVVSGVSASAKSATYEAVATGAGIAAAAVSASADAARLAKDAAASVASAASVVSGTVSSVVESATARVKSEL